MITVLRRGLVDEALYYSFSKERRETVLNYSEKYKKMLTYYHQNWQYLVYPFSIKYRLKNYLVYYMFWFFSTQ